MVSPARSLCYKLLYQVETRGAYSDYVLNSEAVARLEARDRNLATEIVYGALRWQGALDSVLARVLSRPWQEIDAEVKIILRLSLYQMWRMDRVPDHAVVHDAVELAREQGKRGTEGLVNAVLRRLGAERPWTLDAFLKECPPWDRVSLPRWLWERWSQRYGRETAEEYALSLNRPPRTAFRFPPPRQAEEAEPSDSFVASDIVPGAVFLREGSDKLAWAKSNLMVQDEASQLIPHLFGSIDRTWVWDACAAPGGKSSILSQLSGTDGRVVASDLHYHRARRARQVLEASSGAPVDFVVADASGRAPFRRSFDAVLVDVPCSGLGTLRRNPEIKWRVEPEQLQVLQERQSGILASASEAVRVGGLLLYATCSTEPEENEQVVASFLSAHSEYRLVRPTSPPGIDSWLGPDDMLRTFPGTRLWDGFFAALLRRDATETRRHGG